MDEQASEPKKQQPSWRQNMNGLVSVAVFENEVPKKDGTTFMAKSFVLSRRYKDSNGKYHTTYALREQDLMRAIMALWLVAQRVCVYDADQSVGFPEVVI